MAPGPVKFEPVLVLPGEWILWGDIYCGSEEDLRRKGVPGYDQRAEYESHLKSGRRFQKEPGDRREEIRRDGWASGFWVLRPVFKYEDNEWGEVGP